MATFPRTVRERRGFGLPVIESENNAMPILRRWNEKDGEGRDDEVEAKKGAKYLL